MLFGLTLGKALERETLRYLSPAQAVELHVAHPAAEHGNLIRAYDFAAHRDFSFRAGFHLPSTEVENVEEKFPCNVWITGCAGVRDS